MNCCYCDKGADGAMLAMGDKLAHIKEGTVWIADIDKKDIEALKRGEMPK